MFVLLVSLSFLCFSLQAEAANVAAKGPFDSFRLWCVGNCDNGDDVATETTPGAVLMGGGTDTNEAFAWQIENANGGDFVVLRSSGDDAYNDYIYEMSIAMGRKLNSVTTILFNNAKASSESLVLSTLRNAEAVFFAGGDQGEYFEYWSGTEVQAILQSKVDVCTIGGTSAGLAILGNWVYTAVDGSAVSDECLEDPFNKYTHYFEKAFLSIPFMDSIITDTHFVTRNRMGRMLTFMARVRQEYSISAGAVSRGVGVDEHTALLLDTRTGAIKTVGVGTAYVCSSDHESEVCTSGKPLTFRLVECVRLSGKAEDLFSFDNWKGAGVTYINNVTSGHLTDFPYGPNEN